LLLKRLVTLSGKNDLCFTERLGGCLAFRAFQPVRAALRPQFRLQHGFATGEMGFMGQFARQQSETAHVRFGSKSRHCRVIGACPLYPLKADIDRSDDHVSFGQ
jgi:hypothetical protein